MRRPLAMLAEFLKLETAAGFLLMGAALLALVLANSPLAEAYTALLATRLGGLPGHELSLLLWVNDGLMALFFLLVGLEIKREMLVGALASRKRAALPALAALGGMAVPALIYVCLNWHDATRLRGWAIPAATDIAFALGILALLGSRVPAALKLFLTTLAILDDLGAILIIALFYTASISWSALGLAGAALLVLFVLNRRGVTVLWPYLLIGLGLWVAVLASGVHATLAGVALALLIPLKIGDGRQPAPLTRLEHGLHPWVAYGILPVFGLANAGLAFAELNPGDLLAPMPLGIALGLLLGKPVGVMGASWLAVRLRWAEWPAGVTMRQMLGVAVLCGIGFTMSLFIGGLAFPAEEQALVKLGVFSGSLLAAVLGYGILRGAPAARAV